MAWNEPGKPGQDPWGNNSNGPNKPKGQKPDPDLDELLKKLQNFLGGGGSNIGGGFNAKGAGVAVIVAIIIWLLSGIYTVDSPERGVVKRFGAYVEQTTAGLHWHLPWPIESVTLVNVDRIRTAEIGYRSDSRNKGSNVPSESLMLSKDENIVDIKIAVQYKVSDAKKYLYDVSDPDMTLRALTESALREVVGQNTMDFVLTEGRDEVVNKVKIITQKNLDKYETGLFITSLNLQDAQPPEQVQDAFADVVKAREDRERLINEAEAYSNDILPKARGNAARQIEDARAYHDSVIARSKGQASRFDSIVAEYKKAPKVTRERLYIDAITNVLESTSKIFVGSSSSNNLLYLPLDKMIGNTTKVPFKAADKEGSLNTNTSSQPVKSSNPRSNIRELLRTRELR